MMDVETGEGDENTEGQSESESAGSETAESEDSGYDSN